ncbi:MAG: hypothetical protein IT182_19355 [Acidobacteria bacterium]|nr:hypothetical protein [Acidobacteriota bacterium]
MSSLFRPALVVFAALSVLPGCQSPTSPDSTTSYADAVTITAAPDPIIADSDTGGRTYRVVRGNNQPDEILPYRWHGVFATTLAMNSTANDSKLDIDWPVRVTATQLTMKQASAGIITPPTGSETERSEFVTLGATGNAMTNVGAGITLTFEMWYDLPSQRREAVAQVTFSFEDADGTAFSKSVNVAVAP